MIAGANGAGKTTFARELLPALYPGIAFLNVDEVQSEGAPFAHPPTLAPIGLPATGSTCTPSIPPPPTTADLSTSSAASLEDKVAATSARTRNGALSDTQRAWIGLADAVGVHAGV